MFNQIFMSNAIAQASDVAASTTSPDFSLSSFVPLILIFGVFYFLIIRPQSKKYKDHQEMVNSLKTHTKVVTTGGIIGVVTGINKEDGTLEVEIADGVTIKILKNHVADLVKTDKDRKKEEGVVKKNKK